MKRSSVLHASVVSILSAATVLANDPPLIEHQPAQCSVVSKPIEPRRLALAIQALNIAAPHSASPLV